MSKEYIVPKSQIVHNQTEMDNGKPFIADTAASRIWIHLYSPSQNMRWNHELPDYKGGYWTDGVTYTEEELTAADGLGGLGGDNRPSTLAVPNNLALHECGYGHAVGTQTLMDSPSEDYNTRLAWNPSPKGAMQGYDYYQRVSASDRASQYEHLGTISISHASNPIQTTANTVNFRKGPGKTPKKPRKGAGVYSTSVAIPAAAGTSDSSRVFKRAG
ncbi:hypothetical protein B0H13DRAFT_1931376 [Mycena leptocephala]|nr:hypothetical protein B0H13DRAFT_1931376 [Mycena leptocephala]